jgi:hypothetical protein
MCPARGIFERIALPSQGERAAISVKVKTAALCYDRVWATSDDVVPKEVRVWGGSTAELDGRGLAADFNIKTNRAPIAAMVGPEDKKLEMMKAATDYGLGLLLRKIARSFSEKHGVPMTPVYDLASDRESAYHEGDRQVVTSIVSNLEIVDERMLTWEQVLDFRCDEEAQRKYRRFLHWLDKEMVGKSQNFIEDEITEKLEDYAWALRKHGIKTVLGTIEEALDGKYFLGASGVALAGYPELGALAAGVVIAGKMIVKLLRRRLEFEDVERGANSEISWVYELKKLRDEQT